MVKTILIIGLIALPHNTLVLIGFPRIVMSMKMLHRLRAASVIIAGIIVVILNRKRFSG